MSDAASKSFWLLLAGEPSSTSRAALAFSRSISESVPEWLVFSLLLS